MNYYLSKSTYISQIFNKEFTVTQLVKASNPDNAREAVEEDLKTKITGGTLTADDVTLLDSYIAPSMLQWTMYECSASMLFKYRNKSVSTKSSENSQPIDFQDLQFLRDVWKNKAEERDKRLINYLCDNDNLYPKYNESSDDLNPKKTAYQTSFYLGGGASGCWRDDYKYYK